MQRAKQASRVVERQKKRRREELERGEAWERRVNRDRLVRSTNENIRTARKNRQEDWATGALAPRRDVGDKAETYGALTIYDIHLPDKSPQDRPKFIPFADGDRVVITKGKERGKIGYVQNINEEKDTVQVKDMNVVDIFVPDWINREDEAGDRGNIVQNSQHMPLHYVKLVYPLPDPKTGRVRDVIIDRLEPVHVKGKAGASQVVGHKKGAARAIPGVNTIIPWPPKVPFSKPKEEEEFDDDTPRITVDEKTFRPYLLYPPMPMSVVDELRNKYSRFRTRHDWDFVQKKEAEDEREEKRKQLGKTMRTPLQELAELRARQKAAEEKELTNEQLAKIGEVMAQQRSKVTQEIAVQ